MAEGLSAYLYTFIVLLSDNYFKVRREAASRPAGRFLTIATRLPMELQAVLALRTYGSTRGVIPGQRFEWGLKRIFQEEEEF